MTPGGEKMPNIKSAKKRVKVTSTKHESNIPVKGSMKTAVKKVEKDASVENLKIANKRIEKPADVLSVGETVEAKITAIDFDKKRVSLSMRALLPEDEQAPAEATEEVAE